MNADQPPPTNVAQMGRIYTGRLSEAWKGEAADFTPLLADRLDQLGEAIGVDLASIGQAEVATAGGRRIDIVAHDADGAEFVVENQYGKADHDHLTRGLAYAVATKARGLIVVAEDHRDEFRAVAEYLNECAATNTEHGIAVWLVEAKALRVDNSAWAPMFAAVVRPNEFIATVEQAQQARAAITTTTEFLAEVADPTVRTAAATFIEKWRSRPYGTIWIPRNTPRITIVAPGPGKGGTRSVIALFADGHIMVPFHSYAGNNTGISIAPLTTTEFKEEANQLFGFDDSKQMAVTIPGWLTPERIEPLLAYCDSVAAAYAAALAAEEDQLISRDA